MYTKISLTKTCRSCGIESQLVSGILGVCAQCIRQDYAGVRRYIDEAHQAARQKFNLPARPPADADGRRCSLCANECSIPDDGRGFCGLRACRGGQLTGAGADQALVSWYYDSLPTNCVADWVCPGGSGSGYPRYARSAGPELGYKNLAVFYEGCSFDCLYCQNWHYRYSLGKTAAVNAEALASAVDDRTSCVCHFGGDPSPQLPYALRASRLALQRSGSRILRICWETNGSMHPALLKQAASLSLESGGCIKFDLKARNDAIHTALCGVSNKRTLANFRALGDYVKRRPSPPFLIASTLLVPGYIDQEEVSGISSFIASINPDIPYALLAFHPDFMMGDLPPTSSRHAQECLEAARARGLANVRVGNIHLLGNYYE